MSSRTIFGTILAISATVILISQFVNNSSVKTNENFTLGYRLGTTANPEVSLSHSNNCMPVTLSGEATHMGTNVQLMQSENCKKTEQDMFSSFADSAGKNSTSHSVEKSECESANPLETLPLPITGFESTEIGSNDDNSVIIPSRLYYTTLKRKTCGQGDKIRGDLNIKPCPQISVMAAKPCDSLEAGAFAAMFGTHADTAQSTAKLISNDTGGAYTTIGGGNLDQALQTNFGSPASSDTFSSPGYPSC